VVMQERGEDLQAIINIPFEFIVYDWTVNSEQRTENYFFPSL
jgi:hypothetical protein